MKRPASVPAGEPFGRGLSSILEAVVGAGLVPAQGGHKALPYAMRRAHSPLLTAHCPVPVPADCHARSP
jgi:hypothetical protein